MRTYKVMLLTALTCCCAALARASDHLDSPANVANPQADIGDVYGWIAPDTKQLSLVMTIQGHTFSNRVLYTLHIDSGKVFGETSTSTTIECRFDAANAATCKLGDVDVASGDLTQSAGLEGKHHRFRVYAGLRDDPFYNNIQGLNAAYQVANNAIKNGAVLDEAGCAQLDDATTQSVANEMAHSGGGAAANFLDNWTVSAIVVSVDLSVVAKGGKLLAVWGSTSAGGKQLDHMGRPFVANTLLGVAPFSEDDASGQRRQEFNEAVPTSVTGFIADFQRSLAFQDALDGHCGNQFLSQAGPSRYRALAQVIADDRLWINSASSVCTQLFAVELASLAGDKSAGADCGGRGPTYDAANTWRSRVIAGTRDSITDGLHRDEHVPSATRFPFLAAPDAHGVDH